MRGLFEFCLSELFLVVLFMVPAVANDERQAHQQLLWTDEFTDGPAIDSSVWSFDIGDWGWGNEEFQNYTTDNAYIQDGLLHIACHRDGDSFTSARIKTESKLNILYGTIQARIRLPNVANGLWPAFWTLGENFKTVSWPYSGEIDIMEVGKADGIVDGVVNSRVASGVHYDHQDEHIHDSGALDSTFRFDEDFHIYQLDWTPDVARYTVDDELIYEVDLRNFCNGTCTELHEPHFLILNLAVGGGYTYVAGEPWGPERITASFPAIMQVDYVRVYQNGYAQVTGTGQQATASDVAKLCISHSACGDLQGDCCPTEGGVDLSCCDFSTPFSEPDFVLARKAQCQANPRCNTLSLEGSCCPTVEGSDTYLDCCEQIPTRCGGGGDCVVLSATVYAKEMSAGSHLRELSFVVFLTMASCCLLR